MITKHNHYFHTKTAIKMAAEKSEVLTTTNYGLFKLLRGNREINEPHLNRLIHSMSEKYLPVPIIVNKKNEVIDGQHRLAACKNLGLPVYYIKGDDYDLRDVQKINSTSKRWGPNDMAYSYAELGNDNYRIYLDFREEYGFDKGGSVAMLSGMTSDHSGANADFRNGLFKVKNLKYAKEAAEKLYSIEPYYKGFKRRSFVIAMLHLFGNKSYNHKHFLAKLEFNSQKMVDCTTFMQYIKMIEEIYNWKSQEKLRFF